MEFKVINESYPLYYKDNFVMNLDYLNFLNFRVELKKFCNNDKNNKEPNNFYIICEDKKVFFDYKGECSSSAIFSSVTDLLLQLV